MEPVPARNSGITSAESSGTREEILRKLRERIVGFAASKLRGDAAEDLAQRVSHEAGARRGVHRGVADDEARFVVAQRRVRGHAQMRVLAARRQERRIPPRS